MHDYHEALPGFDEAQILHDGCGECEERSKRGDHGLDNLDNGRFVLAWQRAAAWETSGLDNIAEAETPLLRVLWSVQLHFERRGIPIGHVPSASTGAILGAIS